MWSLEGSLMREEGSLMRSARNCGLILLVWMLSAANASATTLFTSDFDPFASDWTIPAGLDAVQNPTGNGATFTIELEATFGRTRSSTFSLGGFDLNDLVFEVNVLAVSGGGSSFVATFFDVGGGFIANRTLGPINSPGLLVVFGSTVAPVPGATQLALQLFLGGAAGDSRQVNLASVSTIPIPEPSTAVLFAFGLIGFALSERPRRA